MDFYKFNLYMDFASFLKMVVSMMAIYMKNLLNRKKGDFLKILNFIIVIIFLNFPQKMSIKAKR